VTSFLPKQHFFFWNNGPLRLNQKPVCSTYFFNRNSIFLSKQFSKNNVFQPVSAKFQQAERVHWIGWLKTITIGNNDLYEA